MRIALYIEDGREEVILTPETEAERLILNKMHEPNKRVVSICIGSFYRTQGGWTREGSIADADSTLLVLDAVETQ